MLTPPPSPPPLPPWIRRELGKWLGDLRDYVASLNPMSSLNVRVYHTARGTSWVGSPASDGAGKPVKPYKLVAIHDDHLNCHSWDGETEGDDIVYIAKPHGLRKTPWQNATVNGITYTFPSADSTQRNATPPASIEHQRIVPYYVEGFSIIYAVEIGDVMDLTVTTDPGPPAVIEPVTFLDLNNDGRAWAK